MPICSGKASWHDSRRPSRLVSGRGFVQRAGIAALSKEGDDAVARMRAVCDKRQKLMVELMREVGFSIPVMPQGAFYVFADASRWTDHSYNFVFELLTT